jgi:uncharacterized protein YceK
MRKLILVAVVLSLLSGCASTRSSLVAGCYRQVDPQTVAKIEYRIEQP